jgi:sensor histidine kinase YesM
MFKKFVNFDQKPAFKSELKRLFYIAISGFIVVTIVRLTLFLDRINNLETLLVQLTLNLVFSFSITTLALSTAHFFTDRLSKELNLIIRLILSFIAMVSSLIAGIYLAQIIIWIIGISSRPYFLTTESFWFSFMFSCIVAIAVTIYYGLKEKLEQAYEQIKIKERQRSELELLKAKADLEALQSKINPHFLFNSLNSIAGLASIAPDKVENTILKLAELFRSTILEKDTFSTIEDEIRLIRNYLDIEKIRFGKRLNYIIDVNNNLDSLKIPHLLVQPIVENAIKHGIEPKLEGGKISISVQMDGKRCCILIQDDGLGINGEITFGYGLTNIKKRLDNLYGTDSTFTIESDNGTRVSITIPTSHETLINQVSQKKIN